MGLSPGHKLKLGFFLAALITQTVAPRMQAFDTSHLVALSSSPEPVIDCKFGSCPTVSKLPRKAEPDILPKRIPDDVSGPVARLSYLVPFPGLRWDALHFLDISLNGAYTYEHQYAFSPGVPVVLRIAHELKLRTLDWFLQRTGSSTYLGSWIMEIMNAFLVSILASRPCLSLYRLTGKVTQSNEFAYLTAAVFILLGAPPVILRSVYTETFFAWFSFEGMSACHDKRFLTASLYFALATSFRANGILLPGFILYGLVVQPILLELVPALRNRPRTQNGISNLLLQSARQLRVGAVIYGLFLTALTIMPFVAQQYMGYVAFCNNSSVISSAIHPRPWCSARLPLIYSFVQSHYWNIGFLRYWTLAQIPNFLLAIPMLALVSFSSMYLLRAGFQQTFAISFHREQDNTKPSTAPEPPLSASKMIILLPYAIHALALSFIMFAAAHVQVALRFLPAATPWAAWAGAALIIKGSAGQLVAIRRASDKIILPKDNDRASPGSSWWPLVSHLWIGWSVIWLFVSSILWLAFLPPA